VRQLTVSPTDKDELVVTRDGRFIVYQQDPHLASKERRQ